MDFVQQNIMWVMAAVISGTMLLVSVARSSGKGVSVTEATLLINREDAVVLDVRETSEWSAGHIPNARHIALGQLDKHLSELEKFKSRPVIICCASGNRSSSACGTLKRAGFERVFNLSGGLGAWTGAGLPVTTKS
ncbi:MAG: rhodanese-like domain-containing protein [Rhodocyclaceae bacterium]|jgi:rhodanese-related sulfurtransferase|nr:rhodanese-like domain-containing protein [Rhodocyclaceae bacterium]MBK6554098.1 rhodanese-like domain-containing protein [Rhodocyclaceae bacterium]MBK6677947.1 rhodanese-like domain-containing protein [Rhodocyclaceae bacterium]MBK7813305.1 rhodanese-like domain-containing protein [Rhodocyclaceae bacterium]MBK9310619.1 rhodanese-like domain-containing protein [Rhodocyclaceae bacterium]